MTDQKGTSRKSASANDTESMAPSGVAKPAGRASGKKTPASPMAAKADADKTVVPAKTARKPAKSVKPADKDSAEKNSSTGKGRRGVRLSSAEAEDSASIRDAVATAAPKKAAAKGVLKKTEGVAESAPKPRAPRSPRATGALKKDTAAPEAVSENIATSIKTLDAAPKSSRGRGVAKTSAGAGNSVSVATTDTGSSAAAVTPQEAPLVGESAAVGTEGTQKTSLGRGRGRGSRRGSAGQANRAEGQQRERTGEQDNAGRMDGQDGSAASTRDVPDNSSPPVFSSDASGKELSGSDAGAFPEVTTDAGMSGTGEKRRRNRSRRGRGRKKNGQDTNPESMNAAGMPEEGVDAAESSNDAEQSAPESSSRSARGRGRSRNSAPEALDVQDSDDDDAVASGKGKADNDDESRQPVRRKMFVSVQPEEQVEVVLTEEGQVQEYYVEMLHQAKTKGNIYKATVHNVDPNLQAAFINYGAVKNGFLQIDEVHPEYYVAPHDGGKGRKYPPIQKVLKAGQELLVQVVKEPSGTKGAFLTTYLSLPGRFLVLTPGREQIGVSRKVEHDEERSRLRELLEGLSPGPGLGVIVRTVSMGASKVNLQRDLQNLKRVWREVRAKGTEEKTPTLIYQEMDLTTRAVRDYLTEQVVEVWLDDEKTANSITEIAETLFPTKKNLVRFHKDAASTLFERFNLQRQLDQIHSREVSLPSGGRLVFDATEALTAIDINSGRSGGKNNFEDMAYRTNMEAAKMIPLQLRLRDIGGQVVADFIEMRDRGHWREVEKTLRSGMKIDRARYDVGKIGPFGMLEIVRQRLGSSAISISSEPCPHCKGTGVRRNMEWQSQQALREIQRLLRAAQGQEPAAVVYEAEPVLMLHLLNSKRQRLVEMEQATGVALEIRPKGLDI